MNEEEVAASFSLLSVEEAEGKEVGLIRRQRKIDESQQGDCSPFRVFVWGLNDKHQLGCLQSDIKVSLLVSVWVCLGWVKVQDVVSVYQ